MQSIARLGVIAALLVGFGWLLLRGGGETEALVGGVVRPAEGHESVSGLDEALQVTEHREPAREAADPDVLVALESIHTASAKAGTFSFLGHLVLPDGQSLVVPELRASIIGPGSFRRTFEGRHVDSFQFDDVPDGAFRFVVEATGYHHRPLHAQLMPFFGVDGPLKVTSWNVTLWPVSWIPIVIRTRDGRPFRALAEELNLEPKRLFVHAFRVAAGHEPFSAGAPLPPVENELAVFHIPQAYQSVSYPGGVACALELRAAPPLWVGLWVHGVFHEVQLLQATDTELLFEIDMAVIDASLARVRARLVDRDSGAPITDARATLKADTSAHRRLDLSNEVPDDMGLLTFERVMPGQHELTIRRDGHLVQRRITLSPAEDLDLGEIPIGSGPGLPIRVVDAEGRPVKAWIEIAPLEPGTYVGELYPPNLHRTTDGQG
ncbi:MAG: hypothetical protein V3T24_08335, partial [Longimicrobiales bacterium]